MLTTLSLSASGDQSLAEKAEMFAQLGKLPLAKNPFFVKSIAMSGQFDGEGTEGMTPGELLVLRWSTFLLLPTLLQVSILLKL